ncbi:MAG: arsenic resistance N-acetyltransferase ArsN2 [archaeon]
MELLRSNGLPPDGLNDHLNMILVLRENERVSGSAALEIYDTAALLRSVAVERQRQGKGWGKQLTNAMLKLAEEKGVTHVYLLTETASDFFERFGFRRVDRSEVPLTVRSSVEFTSACPESAMAMLLPLKQ